MDLSQVKELFTYLNCNNVSYKFFTETWYMEIEVKLQDTTIKFLVEEQHTALGKIVLNLLVEEPSGFNMLCADVSFKLSSDRGLIDHIAQYIGKLAYLRYREGKYIVVKETMVTEKHEVVFYDSFLNHLHAAGFITTDYFQQLEVSSQKVTVFVEYEEQ
jgi:hypothetical protein